MFRICKIECHPQTRYSYPGEGATEYGRSQIISSLDLEAGWETRVWTYNYSLMDCDEQLVESVCDSKDSICERQRISHVESRNCVFVKFICGCKSSELKELFQGSKAGRANA